MGRIGPGDGLRFLLSCGTAALPLGLGLAAEKLYSHDYLGLGFTGTAFVLLRDSVTSAVLFAAGIAAALLVVLLMGLLVGRGVASKRLPFLSGSGETASPARRYATGLTAGLLVILLLSLLGTMIPPAVYAGAAVVALLASGLVAAWRWWKASSSPRSYRILASTASLAITLVFLVALALALDVHSGLYRTMTEVVIRNTALLGSGVAAFVLVRAHLAGRPGESGSTPRSLPTRRWLMLAAGPVVLPLVLWALSPVASRPSLQARNPRNVILIGIDTLRADHTNLPGEARDDRTVTPNLERLAAKGIVFGSAVSQAPWTLPAFASILTGRYPQEHGAMSLRGLLREREVSLAEILREAGYVTGGTVSHVYVDSQRGFAQGFDWFRDDHAQGHWEVTGEGVTDQAIDFLRDHGDDRFFLLVHYFDPHYQYIDHEEWTFADSYQGWLRREPIDIKNLRIKRHLLEPRDVLYLRDLYDEEIAYTDREIGRLVSHLEKEGLTEDTAIIVVSDHGEEFLERGWLGHTISLHEEVIRVPLILALPGVEARGSVIDGAVETRNLFDTVLDYLGLDYPSSNRSLLEAVRDPDNAERRPQEPVYSSVWLPDAESFTGKRVVMSSIYLDGWKLIADHVRERQQLYDLSTDPGERSDVAAKNRHKSRELRGRLDAWVEEMQTGMDVPRSMESEERLRSLGYL